MTYGLICKELNDLGQECERGQRSLWWKLSHGCVWFWLDSETNILPILSLASYKPQTQAKTQNTNQKLREKRERESREGEKKKKEKSFCFLHFFSINLEFGSWRNNLELEVWKINLGNLQLEGKNLTWKLGKVKVNLWWIKLMFHGVVLMYCCLWDACEGILWFILVDCGSMRFGHHDE